MLRAVLDTNILVSGTIHPKGYSRKIVEAWSHYSFILVVSPAIIAEIARVLKYPRIARKYRISNSDIRAVLAQLLIRGELTMDIVPIPDIVKEDPTDNFVLACAEEGEVDYIVSGNRHLLRLDKYKGIPIVTPRAFWEVLSGQN